MAHFAELDNLSYVKRVVVIPNEDILDSEGNESEEIGIARCKELFNGGEWIQTSYNATIRKKLASVGDYYDKERNIFI